MELKYVVKKGLYCLLIAGLYCQAGCMLLGGGGEPEKDDQEILFTEGEKAMEAKDYEQAIRHFQTFMDQFPKSKQYTWALQRLGESYEGLLDFIIQRKSRPAKPSPKRAEPFLKNTAITHAGPKPPMSFSTTACTINCFWRNTPKATLPMKRPTA